MKRAYKFYKNYEFDLKNRLCLSRDDQRIITNFANDVEYNLEDDLSDDIQDLLWTIFQYKKAHITSIDLFENRMKDKIVILNMLQNDNFKTVIKLFLEEKIAKFVLEKLEDVYVEFKDYQYGQTLQKEIRSAKVHGIELDKSIKHAHCLSDVRLIKKLSQKNTLENPTKAYHEIYRMLFRERKINKHKNVAKLKKLINTIFEVRLTDRHIKQASY